MNNCVFFWKNSIFSQWFSSPFTVNNIEYCCAEQYMMAEKARLFNDDETLEKILNTKDPKKMKQLGRSVKNFDVDSWIDNSLDIVVNGNYYKFNQNPEMKKKLLETGDKIIAEASPYDSIWGIGMSENDPKILIISEWGQNKLGVALMKVREMFNLYS